MESSRPGPPSINGKGWPHIRGDAPNEARSGTRYAQALDIIGVEIDEAGTQLGSDSGGGPCPRNGIMRS